MEKLELKHIAPYLPYGLKCLLTKEDFPKHWYMKYIKEDVIEELIGTKYGKFLLGGNKIDVGEWTFKPLLRPLSYLTKEIEHNGERFVPIDVWFPCDSEFEKECNFTPIDHLSNLGQNIDFWPNCFVDDLFKWHFDRFGLIEKGLAIRKEK